MAIDVEYGDKALNHQLLTTGHALARLEEAELHVIHAWRLLGEDYMGGALGHIPSHQLQEAEKKESVIRYKRLHKCLNEAELTEGDNISTHLVRGRASLEISKLAKELPADLLLMGTHARQGFDRLVIGNTAENIAGSAECSLLVIRPDKPF